MQTMRLMVWLAMTCWAGTSVAGMRWETDFEAARQEAAATHRYLLLDFTGSDWCGWCIKLDEEVFSKKEFREFAEQNLVCVLLDFPKGKTLRRSLKEQNDQLAQTHAVRGYPTIIVLAPDGSAVARTGYREGGAESYVSHLDQVITAHRTQNQVPPPKKADAAPTRATAGRPALRPVAKDLAPDATREERSWTSKRGTTVTAVLLQEKGPYVILRQPDGSDVQVAKSSLCSEDQQYISALKERAGAGGP